MEDISCPRCNERISIQTDINMMRQTARCRQCSIQFSIHEDSQKRLRKRAKIDLSQLEIQKNGRVVHITYPWKTTPFMILFAILWNVIVGIFVLGALSSDEFFGSEDKIAYIFLITHPTVGILTGYYVIAGLFNKTTIAVQRAFVTISCAPFPWPGVHKKIHRSEIQQLYVLMYVAFRQNRQPVYRYKIVAQLHREIEDIDLIRGIDNYTRALSLEVTLEDALGITDVSVEGEHLV